MRREDHHPLRERLGRNRPCAVICIRLSSRPSGNGMLKVVEDIDVYLVIRTFLLKKLSAFLTNFGVHSQGPTSHGATTLESWLPEFSST